MANNFRVNVKNRYSRSLFLKVTGDFDGSSAYRLMNVIKAKGKRLQTIVIDTNGLKEVHPFGRDLFNDSLKDMAKHGVDIKFHGRYKQTFEYD